MTVRANFQKNYLMRYAIVAAACSLFALWFAYDGFIGYPSKLPAAEAYDELRVIEDDERRIEEWQEVAEQRGFSKSIPTKTAEEIHSDITGQYFFGALNLVIAIPLTILWLRSRGSWVEATDNGLRSSWGQEVDFSTVSKLDKKKWEKKGIARAHYTEDGTEKAFVFDDFKFEREPINQILRSLEAVLDREQVINGITEEENDEQKARDAEASKEEENESSSTETEQA